MSEVERLQAKVNHFRTLLADVQAKLAKAEEDLAKAVERSHNPQVGDFARSTLTNFYGCVTKVIPRAGGRPWVEITPYLTENLAGKSTMDLYDQWELIDKPVAAAPAGDEPSPVKVVSSIAELLRGPKAAVAAADVTVQIERTAPAVSDQARPAPAMPKTQAVSALMDRKLRLRQDRE